MFYLASRAIIRVGILSAAVGIGIAILVSIANPVGDAPRELSTPPFRILNRNIADEWGDSLRIHHIDSGWFESLGMPRGLVLDKASPSPWIEGGRRQAVGVGWTRSGQGIHQVSGDIAIVRIRLPDNQVLDRVDLAGDPAPTDAPCWSPGKRARLLYPAGDGRIYQIDLERRRNVDQEVRPRRVHWTVQGLEGSRIHVVNLSWPDDPRMAGRVLATVDVYRGAGRRNPGPESQIWWLGLDAEAASVAAAGRLQLGSGPGERVQTIRLPTLIRDAAGEAALAYLVLKPDGRSYEARVVPVRFDPTSGAPGTLTAEARVLANDCILAAAILTLDGRSVSVLRRRGPSLESVLLPLGVTTTIASRVP
ncbi:hypothetical protein EP7_005543 (plasmid) [Isosphaeraceae bacterium EP7]